MSNQAFHCSLDL